MSSEGDFHPLSQTHMTLSDFVQSVDLTGLATALAEEGIDVNQRGKSGRTPLHAAAREPEGLAVLKLLLAHKADVDATDQMGKTPLFLSAMASLPETCSMLLQHKASVNATDCEGRAALHMAVRAESLETTKVLVHAGANADLEDKQGRTAVFWAPKEPRLKELRRLLVKYDDMSLIFVSESRANRRKRLKHDKGRGRRKSLPYNTESQSGYCEYGCC